MNKIKEKFLEKKKPTWIQLFKCKPHKKDTNNNNMILLLLLDGY